MTRLPVAILAGGLATRLGPVARQTPKCLLDVAGGPFLHHQLWQLNRQGVRRVVLCLGHLGEQVTQTIGDGSAFGLDVVLFIRRPGIAGNRRRDQDARCRSWARLSLCSTATRISSAATQLFRKLTKPRASWRS